MSLNKFPAESIDMSEEEPKEKPVTKLWVVCITIFDQDSTWDTNTFIVGVYERKKKANKHCERLNLEIKKRNDTLNKPNMLNSKYSIYNLLDFDGF